MMTMFDLFGFVFKGFVLVWLMIIASIPNIFMGGLTFSVVATVITYLKKKNAAE